MRSDQIAFLLNRRRRRRQHIEKSPLQTGRRIFVFLGAAASLVLVLVLLAVGIVFINLTEDLPSLETLPVMLDLEEGQLLQPTRIYDRTGQVLIATLENPGVERRFLSINPLQPEHFSPVLVQTTVALNDPTFWQNPGFAYWKMASPQPETIAERLVSSLLLDGEKEGLRKTIRMRILAGQAVARYGRPQVLEWFLNSAYYGHLAYGADGAARLYLGKSAADLNLAEAALLEGVLEAPALNPADAPKAARDQQRSTLDRLRSMGVITAQDYDTAVASDLDFAPAPSEARNQAPAFTRLTLEQVSELVGTRRMERGGLRVTATLDAGLQNQLACTARVQLQRLEDAVEGSSPAVDCPASRLLPTLPPSDTALPSTLQTSAVILDVATGQVLALLGDASLQGESASLYGHAPGSLLSPFIALAGFSRGMSPATLVWDIPQSGANEAGGWRNPDGAFHGPQRLRMAVANDYLNPLANLLTQIGPDTVWRLTEPLGLTGFTKTADPAGPLFRGGSVSPLSVAQAYNVFATLGSQVGTMETASGGTQPGMVLAVEDLAGQQLVNRSQPESKPVLSSSLAYLVHSMLSDEQARWPSLGYPNPLEIGRPVGARIGQTADGNDFWTVGYSPSFLAVVWMGLPDDVAESNLNFRMPAGVWHAMMQYLHTQQPVQNWETPPGVSTVQVCDPSGMLPTADCPATVTEVFLSGSEPVETDTLFRKVQINRETGLLATVFTPLELMEDRVFLIVPPEARQWAREAGQALPPTDYDTIQVPPENPEVNISSPRIFSYVHGQVDVVGTAAGDGFSSYRVQIGQGLNPQTWIQLGDEETRPVKSGTLARWNTLGQEGLFAVQLLVVRESQQVDNAVIQVTVDNTPPAGKILYPTAGQVIKNTASQPVAFQLQGSDNIGISRVEWMVDGNRVGETTQPPFSLAWQPETGKHTLACRVTDLAGNASEIAMVEFEIE